MSKLITKSWRVFLAFLVCVMLIFTMSLSTITSGAEGTEGTEGTVGTEDTTDIVIRPAAEVEKAAPVITYTPTGKVSDGVYGLNITGTYDVVIPQGETKWTNSWFVRFDFPFYYDSNPFASEVSSSAVSIKINGETKDILSVFNQCEAVPLSESSSASIEFSDLSANGENLFEEGKTTKVEITYYGKFTNGIQDLPPSNEDADAPYLVPCYAGLSYSYETDQNTYTGSVDPRETAFHIPNPTYENQPYRHRLSEDKKQLEIRGLPNFNSDIGIRAIMLFAFDLRKIDRKTIEATTDYDDLRDILADEDGINLIAKVDLLYVANTEHKILPFSFSSPAQYNMEIGMLYDIDGGNPEGESIQTQAEGMVSTFATMPVTVDPGLSVDDVGVLILAGGLSGNVAKAYFDTGIPWDYNPANPNGQGPSSPSTNDTANTVALSTTLGLMIAFLAVAMRRRFKDIAKLC